MNKGIDYLKSRDTDHDGLLEQYPSNEDWILLSKLVSEDQLHPHAFYEWVNPNTGKGDGAYPFRTGISAIRIAIADILWRKKIAD